MTVAFYKSTKDTKQHTRFEKYLQLHQPRSAQNNQSSLSVSADPVGYFHFRERFPEKAYGSNCRSCEVKEASLQKAAIILNKRAFNPLFPYLGKKIFLLLIGQKINPSMVPNQGRGRTLCDAWHFFCIWIIQQKVTSHPVK